MKKITVYTLLYLLLCPGLLFGQENVENKMAGNLNIGDPMPDIAISGVKNYSGSVLRFSELKNKLVILDFWFGACHGCIEAFPKMERLQQRFGDQIQIITVNFESQAKIDATFKKWVKTSLSYREPKLPSIVGDTILHRLFSFQYYPHEVWIDGDGKIIGFTSGEEVNEKNINALLNHLPVNMDMKFDFISYNDYKYSMFSQVHTTYPSKLKYYSVVMDFIPGINGSGLTSISDTVNNTIRITRTNGSLLDLLCEAATNGIINYPLESAKFDFGKRVQLSVRDASKYFHSVKDELSFDQWRKKNGLNYELVLPLSQKERIFTYMLTDLERSFNVVCKIEKQLLPCLALVRTSGIDKLAAKTKPITIFDSRRDTTKLQLYSGRMEQFVDAVSEANRKSAYLFADDTKYSHLVDMELPRDVLSDLKTLNRFLSKYDLQFVEKTLQLDVLIVKENPNADGNGAF